MTTARTSGIGAPTRLRSDRSTCSPVVALVPGVHKSVWSSVHVPTMTTDASAALAAAMAAGMPEGSFDQSSQPCSWVILTDVLERSWVNPASGEMPLLEALKKT